MRERNEGCELVSHLLFTSSTRETDLDRLCDQPLRFETLPPCLVLLLPHFMLFPTHFVSAVQTISPSARLRSRVLESHPVKTDVLTVSV